MLWWATLFCWSILEQMDVSKAIGFLYIFTSLWSSQTIRAFLSMQKTLHTGFSLLPSWRLLSKKSCISVFFPVFVQHCSLWCAFQVGTADCSVFCHMASLVTVQNVIYASMVFFSRALEVWVLVRYRRGWATPHSLWNTVFALLGFARCARIGTQGRAWVQFPSRFGSAPFVMWACP